MLLRLGESMITPYKYTSYYHTTGLIVRPCQVECFGIAQHKLKTKPGKITLRFRSERHSKKN